MNKTIKNLAKPNISIINFFFNKWLMQQKIYSLKNLLLTMQIIINFIHNSHQLSHSIYNNKIILKYQI